jgi:hypothetical protein
MSGRPYTYSRGMAIAQLMRDMRRSALQKIVEQNKEHHESLVKRRDESGLDYPVLGPHGPQTVYLHGEDLYVAYSDTIDWVPKLEKLTKYGRHSMYLTDAQIAVETDDPKQFPMHWSGILNRQEYHEPIEGWPTEAEIAAEIAASAEREKNWKGSLSANDISAFERMAG